jgi:hypothetical protein
VKKIIEEDKKSGKNNKALGAPTDYADLVSFIISNPFISNSTKGGASTRGESSGTLPKIYTVLLLLFFFPALLYFVVDRRKFLSVVGILGPLAVLMISFGYHFLAENKQRQGKTRENNILT